MFRFTIRELLLITAIVGIVIAWRTEVATHEWALKHTRIHAERLRNSLRFAKSEVDMRIHSENHPDSRERFDWNEANWSLIDQPIP